MTIRGWRPALPTRALLAAVVVLLAPLPPATAQQPAGPAPLRMARRAQAQFESARMRHLPDRASGGERCDARIGRFCYWYDEDDPEPPAEPVRVARERGRLLAALDSAAALAPDDPWIAGQRVRYRVEAGRAHEARAVAAACAASTPGWCAALAGLAAHAAGDGPAADSAFDDALARFPAAERCRWTDLAPLLAGPLRARYERVPCTDRDSLERRIWWLAEPLYAHPATSVRAEHFARLTMARLQQATRSPLDPAWGDDLHELLVRYGWPTAYTRDRMREGTALGAGAKPRVSGHEPRPSYHFFPALRAVERPADARGDDWDLTARDAPTRYAPGLRLAPLRHQSAWFRRGDSTLVVAAYDPAADTALARSRVEPALVLWQDERTAPVVVRGSADTAHGAGAAPRARTLLAATAPWRPALVAVEVLAGDSATTYAARARYGLAEPAAATALALSAILLFDPADTLPTSLAGALPAMRTSDRARRGERLGLLWEIYGLADSTEAVTVSLGLRRRARPVRLRWGTRAAGTAGVATGAITLRLAELPPGRYRLSVAVRTARGDSATTAREVELRR